MNKKLGFTFVELIIVVTILGILSTLGFISYSSSLGDARDGTRISDIAAIGSTLKQYKQSRGSYPIASPGNNFYIMVGSTTGALQGTMNTDVTLSTLDNVPRDPKVGVYYSYSTTMNRQEYQIAGTLENSDTPLAILKGDFSAVSQALLPTIMIASGSTTSIDVSVHDNLFVFDNQIHNLVYDFSGDNIPVSDGTASVTLLSEAQSDGSFWQNSDFTSCIELSNANKLTGSGIYQTVNPSTGVLEDTSC